jgi:hypothetical protein
MSKLQELGGEFSRKIKISHKVEGTRFINVTMLRIIQTEPRAWIGLDDADCGRAEE